MAVSWQDCWTMSHSNGGVEAGLWYCGQQHLPHHHGHHHDHHQHYQVLEVHRELVKLRARECTMQKLFSMGCGFTQFLRQSVHFHHKTWYTVYIIYVFLSLLMVSRMVIIFFIPNRMFCYLSFEEMLSARLVFIDTIMIWYDFVWPHFFSQVCLKWKEFIDDHVSWRNVVLSFFKC